MLNSIYETMRQIITFIVLMLFVACNTLELEVPNDDSVMSAYFGKDYWAADSLTEAYFFKNTLYINAKGGERDIILRIEDPFIGKNSNIGFVYSGTNSMDYKSVKKSEINVTLNILDTIDAEPSIVNGTFSGMFLTLEGNTIEIKEGKINNAITENLFCENNIRSFSSKNTDIGGQWELVRLVNRKTGKIQNPTCNGKIIMSFFTENYQTDKIDMCDCNFEIQGPANVLRGDFDLLNGSDIDFYNQAQTYVETSLYNEFLERLVFSAIARSNSVFINNTLMHLESSDYITVFYRRD